MASKIVLVTGGQGGIGRAIVARLCQDHVVVSGDVVVSAEQHGTWKDDATYLVHLDVTSRDSVERGVAAAAALGDLVGVVNCAGVLRAAGPEEWPEDRFREMFDINFFGAVRVTTAALPHLKDGSAIVNVSSISCRLNDQPDIALYGASKAALESYTRGNAHQLRGRGIRVNAIAPGVIDVDMSEDMRRVAESETSPLKRCPLERMGTAEEVAECVEFLLSSRASYVNGTTLIADGGICGS